MKLYHFLSERWALEALKKQRLKVSKYETLNDPFELISMAMDDKFARKMMIETKKKINDKMRILCCSQSWNSPLLWGHYADRHTGIAIELEVPETHVKPITYAKDRKSIDIHSLMQNRDEEAKLALFDMFTTKYHQWSYEDEARIQFMKDELLSEGEHEFTQLDNHIQITGVILGALNNTTDQQLIEKLPVGSVLNVTKSRVAFKSFDIVKNRAKPTYQVRAKG